MEKNTKGKLLAIGILVLLLVSMIPMAAMAASSDKPIRMTVYEVSGCTDSLCTAVDGKVGSYAIGKLTSSDSCGIIDTEFPISMSVNKLEPRAYYYAYVMGPYSSGSCEKLVFLAVYVTDDRGRIKDIMPTCGDATDRQNVVNDLNSGEFIGLMFHDYTPY